MVKKIHSLLSGGRFAIVRQMMQESTADDVKEFLLLASKCHSLSDHDQKIFHSLAEVAHPSLAKARKKQEPSTSQDTQVIWTTMEGYQKLQHRIQQIATVETVENAKEIEIARSHGDLRENAEFKAALEKRDRLQSELKFLSEQLSRARVLTKDDIATDAVSVGSIIECMNKKDQKVTYTLLGPWDADTDKNILSFQSKLAQSLVGKGVGDKFTVQGEELTIHAIRSYL
jgi:transcription elongation factor GreA